MRSLLTRVNSHSSPAARRSPGSIVVRSSSSSRVQPATMSTPIQEYIDKHALQKKVEDVLNACVSAKPADPLAFMVSVAGVWSAAVQCSAAALCCCQTLWRPRRDRSARAALAAIRSSPLWMHRMGGLACQGGTEAAGRCKSPGPQRTHMLPACAIVLVPFAAPLCIVRQPPWHRTLFCSLTMRQ